MVVAHSIAAVRGLGVFGGIIDNRPEVATQARIIREMGQEFIRRARVLSHGREPIGHALALATPACARRDPTEREMVDALLRLAETVPEDLAALMASCDVEVQVRSLYDLGRALLDHGTYVAVWLAGNGMSQREIGKYMGVTGPRVSQWRTAEKSSHRQ